MKVTVERSSIDVNESSTDVAYDDDAISFGISSSRSSSCDRRRNRKSLQLRDEDSVQRFSVLSNSSMENSLRSDDDSISRQRIDPGTLLESCSHLIENKLEEESVSFIEEFGNTNVSSNDKSTDNSDDNYNNVDQERRLTADNNSNFFEQNVGANNNQSDFQTSIHETRRYDDDIEDNIASYENGVDDESDGNDTETNLPST